MDDDPDFTTVHVFCINTKFISHMHFCLLLVFSYLGIERYYTMVDHLKIERFHRLCMYVLLCMCLLLYSSVVGQNISSFILVLLVREDRIIAIYGILIFKPFSYSGHFPVPEK